MAIPAVVTILPVGILFILSGLIVNLMQAILFILIRPISKKLYRTINKEVAELLWLELIWLIDWWAGIKVELYVDPDTFQLMGKEHALLICNHKSDIDWLVGWVIAQRSGCLGSALAIMKKEVMFLPVIGWSMWFCEYIFLERTWSKDERTLKSGFRRLEDFPMPFWLALFVEGTRFTQSKLMAAQEYAVSRGLPIPRNVLLPRTKGFIASVSHMRSFVPAIYDCTLAISNNQPPPTLLRMFRGQSSVFHISFVSFKIVFNTHSCSVLVQEQNQGNMISYNVEQRPLGKSLLMPTGKITRHSMQDLPESGDGIGQWCKDVFVTKDAVLEKYYSKATFSELQLQNIDRPIKSLLVVIIWSCLLGYGMFKFVQWSSLLSTWEGIAFSVTVLFLVVILMQILIQSSESERSTPLKAPPKDPVQERLILS